MEITNGDKVPVVYDSIGKDTFTGSLDCLQPLGMMVSFGNASGAGAAVLADRAGHRAARCSSRGRRCSPTRPRAPSWKRWRPTCSTMVASGKVKIEINQRYPLADAAQAHIALEARKTTGSTILLP